MSSENSKNQKTVELLHQDSSTFTVKIGNKIVQGDYYQTADFLDLHLPEGNFRISKKIKKSRSSKQESHEGELVAPMPGKIIKIFSKEKAKVKKGDLLLVLEAMKMEHKIVAPKDGVVEKIHFKEGERVSQGDELVEISSSS